MLMQAPQLLTCLDTDNLLIFDCRFSLPGPGFDPDAGRKAYQTIHIPHAIYVDLEKDLSSTPTPSTGRHPLPIGDVFLDALQKWGVEPAKNIVIYDDKGNAIAARLWWLLRHWVGHEQVSLLDGGFTAWTDLSFPVSAEAADPTPTKYRYHIDNSSIRTTQDIQQLSASQVVIDARAHNRFIGEDENVDPVAGHIPGAINLPCMGNLDTSGKFLSLETLTERFEKITQQYRNPENVIHSCGSGVTACHNLFAMELAGYSGTTLYAGSWSEWIRDASNPVSTGE